MLLENQKFITEFKIVCTQVEKKIASELQQRFEKLTNLSETDFEIARESIRVEMIHKYSKTLLMEAQELILDYANSSPEKVEELAKIVHEISKQKFLEQLAK